MLSRTPTAEEAYFAAQEVCRAAAPSRPCEAALLLAASAKRDAVVQRYRNGDYLWAVFLIGSDEGRRVCWEDAAFEALLAEVLGRILRHRPALRAKILADKYAVPL
jgi:hypothetical protein